MRIAVLLTLCIFSYADLKAQLCPPNIDFENGTFSNWTCHLGSTRAQGDENIIDLTPTSSPMLGRQTMFAASSNQFDPYGGFPVTCPNGSGYSVRLGNDQGGGQAEGISYEFTIPWNDNNFSLIYHYAVVFQSPNHRPNEQPRMEIEVTNVTDNKRIDCASFAFIAVGTSLPGFEVSQATDTVAVLYKDWSAVTVDLSGLAGKTINMFFKTADCTFRRHFGYAYIDVDSECSGTFVGATYCPDDTAINITAPFGYQNYVWYDSSLTNVIGGGQNLHLTPPPKAGTSIAVKLEPYDGYGCPKTMFAKLNDTLTVTANAGADVLACNEHQVRIGGPGKQGWNYSWVPETGLSNPHIPSPMAAPALTTSYVVKTTNGGGGCLTMDTVIVRASHIDTTLQLTGKASFCIDNGDSALLHVTPANSIQWFKNGLKIPGAQQPTLRVNNSGSYSALLSNTDGCNVLTNVQKIVMDKALPGTAYPVAYAIKNIPLELNARNIGETATWSPAINLSAANSFTPTFTGNTGRLYTINIKTVTECLTVDTQLVKTIEGIEIYVPTAFTPNNDGRNDLLRPILRGIKELRYFRVFNRWGNLLYEDRKDLPGWNGIYNGALQQTQSVVWALECVGLDNVTYKRTGTTVLLR